MTPEQMHLTLMLKGWHRTGTRSYYNTLPNGGYVIATAGYNSCVQASPSWTPWRREFGRLGRHYMTQVFNLVEAYECQS